jgi:hypothetical protein
MFKIRILKDFPGIGSINGFKIDRYATSLLGGVQADVTLKYSNKKEVMIFGDEKDVFQETLKRIRLIKNPNKAKQMAEIFNAQYKGTDIGARAKLGKGLNKMIMDKYYNPFSVGKPENLLNEALMRRDLTVKDLANEMKAEQKVSTTYTHTSGSRAISREVALKYSDILKCDPVDLMFNKVTIPVWGKVNLMQPVDLEKTYSPGEIYTYATNAADTEITIVPRDLWRSDIKAIKVDAKGTMYHNQVAFYYYKQGNDDAALNKLCIVGRKIQPNPELDPDYYITEYYFGVYENNRGRSNLINPDPFVEEENKIILKNFRPTFVAPVVSMVNTDALVDDTNKVDSIPQSEWRKEESLRIERAQLIKRLSEKSISEKQYASQVLKINNEMKHYELELQKKIIEQQERVEKSLLESMKKLEAVEKAKAVPLFSLKKFSNKKLA